MRVQYQKRGSLLALGYAKDNIKTYEFLSIFKLMLKNTSQKAYMIFSLHIYISS